MANIKVDYETTRGVATALDTVATQTVPRLAALRDSVSQLLQSSGGLWLKQSSPELSRRYEEFNTGITSMVNNIPLFARQFNGIVTSLNEMDQSILKSPAK
jgi:hypothetical protein